MGFDPRDPHILINAAWLVMLAVWLIGALTAKRAVRRYSSALRVFETVLVMAAYFLEFDPQTAVGFLGRRFLPLSEAVSWIGFAITLGGLFFALWARFTIGRNWSGAVTVKVDHQLIRRGPYALVRHPIYSGLLLALLGTAIAVGEIRGLVGLLLAAIAWRLKSLVEEQYMTEQFGTQYARYKQDVKALVPFIW